MGTLDDIRPLTPTPPYTSIDQRRPTRKPREERPANHPRRQTGDSQEDPDSSPPHLDEYA